MGPKKIQEDLETLHYLGPRQKPLTLKEIIGTEGSFKNRKRVSTATKTALRTTFHMKTSWRMNAINNRNWLNKL
jgi:hypothetical protein